MAACTFVAVPMLTWAGCGDDGESSGCTPGETKECICPPARQGAQTCSADGASFSECNCSPTTGGVGGSAGAGGRGSVGNAGTSMGGGGGADDLSEFTGFTGIECATDTDCAGGMTCFPSTGATNPFGAGSVQGGFCSATCTGDEAGSLGCQAVDSFSDCIVFEANPSTGYCLPLCPVTQPSAQRCAGRVDLACVASTAIDPGLQVGLCRPYCFSDLDCGGGKLCDSGTGFCVDALPTRGPGVIGAACTPTVPANSLSTECISGFCLDTGDGGGFCSARCVVGPIAGCGFSEDASPRDAACVPVTQNPGIGDRGVCLELCDTVADCEQSAYLCDVQSAQAQAALGRAGLCVPDDAAVAADAGADGG